MVRAAALFSGGKDSVYAVLIAQQQCMEVAETLTVVPAHPDSYMFHVPNIAFAPVVSAALGLRNITFEMAEADEEIDRLRRAIGSLEIDTVITGAIASDYQASRIDMICQEQGLRVFSPLWHKDEERLLRDMVSAGLRVIVVSASAEGLGPDWLGRELDPRAVDELVSLSGEQGIHVGGEGGEFETMVLDAPAFSSRIEIASSRAVWSGGSGVLRIDAVRLFPKV